MRSHLRVSKEDGREAALVCGAPERVALISSRFGGRLVAQNREYHTYNIPHRGTEILVVSHGVGSSGAAICFHELIDLGVKNIIRLGTAGGLGSGSQVGDRVIPTGAVRKDGVSLQMIPAEYPAVPDFGLTLRLQDEANRAGVKFESGIVASSDVFYPGPLDPGLEFYSKAGVIAVEMECSTLFVIGSLRKIRTASFLVLDGNPLKWDAGVYDPEAPALKQSIDFGIQICLDTLAS